jgi:phosphoglycerate dehydrogenase-like enzyme
MPSSPRIKLLMVLHHRFELWNAPAWVPQRLRAEFPEVEVVHRTDYTDLEQQIRDADVYIGWSLRPEQLRAASRLRWIHSPAAAVHQLMSPELAASDIIVTNAREVHGPVVAEHALALMMALAKRLPSCMRYQRQHFWGQEALWHERPRPRELAGSTLCLVGLGSIGRNVAQRALALGMRVRCVRQHPSIDAANTLAGDLKVAAPSALDSFLEEADFVVLAAPLTAETEGMMNAGRLAKMRPEAYLINVARGPLVDQAALLAALKGRKIAGAALDVFPAEPLPTDSPFWDLENLIITPHSAGITERLWERHYVLIAENLRRFLSGVPLLAQINKHRGY